MGNMLTTTGSSPDTPIGPFGLASGNVTPIMSIATPPPSLATAATIAARHRLMEEALRLHLSAPSGSDPPAGAILVPSDVSNQAAQPHQNMLSDHSSDEGEGQTSQPERYNPYITIPSSTSKAYESYRTLRHEIIVRAGIIYDVPPPSMAMPSTINEVYVPDASYSSTRNILKNARYGLRPRPCCRVNGAVDETTIAAIRNRTTPNRRKIIDRTTTKTFCVEYINNGDSILTASQDNKLRIYNQTGARRRYIKAREITTPFVGWSVMDFAVSPDGHHAVYATWHNGLFQCDLREEIPHWQEQQLSPIEERFAIFSIKFNSTGTEIAAGGTNGLFVYDREVGETVFNVQAHADDVNAVCFLDGTSNLLLSSGDDGLIKLWDRRASDRKRVSVFSGHRDGITYLDSKKDGRFFLSNSKDQSIKVWDVRLVSDRTGIESTLNSVSGQRWDYRWQMTRHFKTSNLPGDSSVMTLRGHSVLHTLIRAKFSPTRTTGNRFIYTGCARGACLVYDLYTGLMHKRYGCHRSVVRDCVWHPYENEIVTSSWDGNLFVWRFDRRRSMGRHLNPESQLPHENDTSDEFDEPIQQIETQDRAPKRTLPVRPVPPNWLNLSGNQSQANRIQLKIARQENDDSSSEEDARDESYSEIARRRVRRNN